MRLNTYLFTQIEKYIIHFFNPPPFLNAHPYGFYDFICWKYFIIQYTFGFSETTYPSGIIFLLVNMCIFIKYSHRPIRSSLLYSSLPMIFCVTFWTDVFFNIIDNCITCYHVFTYKVFIYLLVRKNIYCILQCNFYLTRFLLRRLQKEQCQNVSN